MPSFIAVALSALLLLIGVSVRHDGQARAAAEHVQDAVSGASFRIIANASATYATEHPGTTGAISQEALSGYLPSGFDMPGQIQVIATATRTFVFIPAASAPPLSAVFPGSDFPAASVGIARSGKLISPGYSEGIAYSLPEAIPEGALVYVV